MRHILLAIDDVSLLWRKNACLYLNEPAVRPEPALAPSPVDSDAPDEDLCPLYRGAALTAAKGLLPDGQIEYN